MPKDAPYFDLQVNGFAGIDFQQDDLTTTTLEHAMTALLRHGTGRILFTLITDRIEVLCRRLEAVEKIRSQSQLAHEVIAGYHLEGPWLSPEPGYHGAHDPDRMKNPTIIDLDRFLDASGGNLRLITLAPELPGSAEVIAHASSREITTSIGHSNANDDEIDTAISAGLTLCTHLGNGVPMMLHRHDNIIQRLLARDELTAVFIPDGIHIPPAILRNFVRSKPPEKVIFTTDCMAAAGAPSGRYTLGSLEMEVAEDGIVRQPGKDNFAGSSLTMDRAITNISRFLDWTPQQAIKACSENASAALGLPF